MLEHKEQPLGRQPVLSENGKVFCSPQCGFKCTKEEHDWCVLEAVKLCAMLGDGFEPVVWENCRWHYKAASKFVHVYPEYDYQTRELYGYWIDSRFGEEQFCLHCSDPIEGVKAVWKQALEKETKMKSDLGEFRINFPIFFGE